MSGQPEEEVARLIRDAIGVYRDDPIAVATLEAHARRMDEPLRIAVVGMVKAGKSTLINALLGEEIAPTDTGECTRTVTWYRYGDTPRVTVFPVIGEPRTLPVHHIDGRPQLQLDGLRAEDVRRLVIEWPAERLRHIVLIDTPGIASLSGAVSERTHQVLVPDDGPSEVDAIIYVLRHLREADLAFLKTYRDAGGGHSGGVNCLVVLSRADEIGAGRIGALLAARDIAKRYRSDKTLRSVAAGVVPVAGRLAQTARTLHQWEVDALTSLARLDRKERDKLLISADRFARVGPVEAGGPQDRARLLDRFGIFGIRLAVVLIQNGFTERQPLANELARRSGLNELDELITTHFSLRASQLKALTAVARIDALVQRRPAIEEGRLRAAIEAQRAGAHGLRELRLLAIAHTTGIDLEPELTAEALRLIGSHGLMPTERLGLDSQAPESEVRTMALVQVRRWRGRAEHPLTDRATAEVCRIVVRSCEGILAQTEESGARAAAGSSLGTEPGAGRTSEARH